jgi:hypothetical protein
MKSAIKFISLLIVGGLILTFYYSGENSNKRMRPHECFGSHTFNHVLKVKPAPPGPKGDSEGASVGFSILKDIAGELFPILKNLN